MSQVEQESGDPEAEENPEPEEDTDWTARALDRDGSAEGHSTEADEPEANSGFSVCPDINSAEDHIQIDTDNVTFVEGSCGDQPYVNITEADHVSGSADSVEGFCELDEGAAATESDTDVKQQAFSESDRQFEKSPIQVLEGNLSENQVAKEPTGLVSCNTGANHLPALEASNVESNADDSTSPSTFSGDVQIESVLGSDAPEDEIPSNSAMAHVAVLSSLENDVDPVDGDANGLMIQPTQQEVSKNDVVNSSCAESGSAMDSDKDSQTPECDRDSKGSFQSFCDISLEKQNFSSHNGVASASEEREKSASEEREKKEDSSEEVLKKDIPSVLGCDPSSCVNSSTSKLPYSDDSTNIPDNTQATLKVADSALSVSETKSRTEQLSAVNPNDSSRPVDELSQQIMLSDSPTSFILSSSSSSSSTSSPEKQILDRHAPSDHPSNQSPSSKPGKREGTFPSGLSVDSAVLQTTRISHHSPQTEKANASAQPISSDIKEQLEHILYDDDDDLDDIMSELDAELLSRSPSHHQHSAKKPSPKSTVLDRGDLSMRVNGIVAADVRQLQDHNRQLLQQLRLRDQEIGSLSREKESMKGELSLTQSERDDLLKKLSTSSNHNAEDIYIAQIKEFEKTIAQQQDDIRFTKEKLTSHDAAAKRAVTTLQNELKCRVDQVTKLYEEAVKEKDAIVVKFAGSESKSMENKRSMEKQEARMKEALRDREQMGQAFKIAKADRQKAVNSLETKCNEVANIHKELEKMKEAISSSDYRIKWFQNKLKDELEAHKETKTTLEKTVSKLKEAREETEVIRKECQAIVKTYQESEEIKSNSLDKELKIKESQLKLQMQEFSDTEEIQRKTMKELDSIKAQHKQTLEELRSLHQKANGLEEMLSEKEMTVGHLEESLKNKKTANEKLQGRIDASGNLAEDFSRAQDMIKTLDKDVADLKINNLDLQKDMESCRERESKMLALQSELSRTNALLRSENTNLSNKASNLTAEVEKLKMEVQELETTVKHLNDSYEDGKKKKNEEIVVLKNSLEVKTKECSEYKQKWEDEMDSNKTLKRRHANNVKDLTRQLMQAKRKLDNVEGSKDGGSMGSRTNSNGSLNSIDNSSSHNTASHSQANPQQEFPVITEQVEVDKHVLIERIVRLQKSHARKNEKLEFLSEHIHQLLEEIKKKNKIIQSYVLREEAGTLSSEDMDANKAEAQKEMQTLLARKGGIMASLYSLHQQDGHMTLELSLQINKKLQAVLEDTLLKNITLKENLDTLGEEIARLSQQNRKLQLHLQDLEATSSGRKAIS